jgi:hypothetical protein
LEADDRQADVTAVILARGEPELPEPGADLEAQLGRQHHAAQERLGVGVHEFRLLRDFGKYRSHECIRVHCAAELALNGRELRLDQFLHGRVLLYGDRRRGQIGHAATSFVISAYFWSATDWKSPP